MTHFYTNVTRRGRHLLVREWDGHSHKQFKVEFSPTFYTPTNEVTDWTTFDGRCNLAPRRLDTMMDAKDFLNQFDGCDGFAAYGTKNYINQYITDRYADKIEFDESHIRCFNFDIEVVDIYSEIPNSFPEPDYAEVVIPSIALHDSFTDRYYVWGLGEYNNTRDDVVYYYCADEETLLMSFIDFWEKNCPHVITGWNINTFDIPYLINRIKKLLGESQAKRLSPWKMLNEITIKSMYSSKESYEIVGIATLDYIELYKKHTFVPRESYALNYIAYAELEEEKLDYSEIGSIHTLFRDHFQTAIDYNIKDVELVVRIDSKMSLLGLVYSLAYYSHQPYNDTFSPVKTWEALIYNYAISKNHMFKINEPGHRQGFVGAYVKPPLMGLYRWIVSIDAASLYPSIIRQHNISNEMILEDPLPPELAEIRRICKGMRFDDFVEAWISQEIDLSACKKYGVTIVPAFERTETDIPDVDVQFFQIAEQSVNSIMMENLYKERKAQKSFMMEKKREEQENGKSPELTALISTYNNAQMVRKTLLNSAFGASGNPYYNFYDVRIAQSITSTGQILNKLLANRLNTFFNKTCNTTGVDYIIAGDTDSWYINMEPITFLHPRHESLSEPEMVDFLDDFMKKIVQPIIDRTFKEYIAYTNARELMIFVDREAIASAGFWTAKKRYALLVHDNEGVRYKKPKVKVLGIEVVKSNTPEFCRKKLKSIIELMLTTDNDTVLEYIEDTRREFNKLPVEEVAQPGGVSGLVKYKGEGDELAIKGAQAQVRGSLMYNRMIEQRNMIERYRIRDGDKIKKAFLKTPNSIGQNIIAFPTNENLPPEFDLHKYVSYPIMFDKTFFVPLRNMLDSVGWKSEDTGDLSAFFG